MPSQIRGNKNLPGGSFPVELMDIKGSCGQGNATPVKHKVKFLFKLFFSQVWEALLPGKQQTYPSPGHWTTN